MIDEDSNQVRKAHGRRLENYGVKIEHRKRVGPTISFRPKDLEVVSIPHTNALVICATIANYDMAQVFVDTGSSIDILFKNIFDQMQVELIELCPISTFLFEFIGQWFNR